VLKYAPAPLPSPKVAVVEPASAVVKQPRVVGEGEGVGVLEADADGGGCEAAPREAPTEGVALGVREGEGAKQASARMRLLPESATYSVAPSYAAAAGALKDDSEEKPSA
jgi:hypothetical protein